MSNSGFAATLGRFFGNLKTQAQVQLLKRDLNAAVNERNRRMTEIYSAIYLGDAFRASISTIALQMERYQAYEAPDWSIYRNLDATGTLLEVRLTNDFQEVFVLGELGCKLEPRTAAGGVLKNMMEYRNQTQNVVVPYRLLMDLRFRAAGGEGVRMSGNLTEQIDPRNQVKYLRSGNFAAPSMLPYRFTGDPLAAVRSYLHDNCSEDRPGIQQWAMLESTNRMQEVADLNRRVLEAEAALNAAKANLS